MKQIFKLLSFVISCLFLPNQANGQEKTNHSSSKKFLFSAEILFARDYTKMVPSDGNDTWTSSYVQPALNVNLRFKSFDNLHLEVGYRYKQHLLSFTHEKLLSFSSTLIAESHSLPMRMVWEKSTRNRRFTVAISGGVMASYLYGAYSRGTLGIGVTLPTGTYTGAVFLEDRVRNTPHFIHFLDGAIRADLRVFKSLYFTLGYGATKSFYNLSEGSYIVTGPSLAVPSSGKFFQVGSYDYWLLGLKFPLSFHKYGS
jgi:hypothetical protein